MIVYDFEQGSLEWHQCRAGIPTASEYSNVITGTGKPANTASVKRYARRLAAEAYAGRALDNWDGNYHTRRGKELEPDACDLYALLKDVEPVVVGFITTDDGRYGCSPDRLVLDQGLLEVKCLSTEEHVSFLTYYNKHKTAPPGYTQQVQGQMMVAERSWADQLFYHPHLPSIIVNQMVDPVFQRDLKKQLSLLLLERDKYIQEIKKND